jgi:MFS family permease
MDNSVEFLSGFAPTLTVLIILRALYGIAMGGERNFWRTFLWCVL